jgi:hypothetical protein
LPKFPKPDRFRLHGSIWLAGKVLEGKGRLTTIPEILPMSFGELSWLIEADTTEIHHTTMLELARRLS